jgi:hypothetical protein
VSVIAGDTGQKLKNNIRGVIYVCLVFTGGGGEMVLFHIERGAKIERQTPSSPAACICIFIELAAHLKEEKSPLKMQSRVFLGAKGRGSFWHPMCQ